MDQSRRLARLLPHLPPLMLCAALSLVVTFPLWLAPGARAEDLGDPLLNSWILAWDHYAFFHQLFDFFQANIFWPHAYSLAYGEHMLTQAVLALPFYLFTDQPVAIHNLSLIQGFFLSAAAAYGLGWHYFRRVAPATVCALAYAFAGYHALQIGHVQLIHTEFLPLMFLAFERLLAGGGRGWRWLLGLAALGQWLTSWYWTVFTFWIFVPYAAVRLWQERRRLSVRWLAGFVIPLMLAAACTLPVAWPYIHLKDYNYLIRPPEAAVAFVAHPADYLVPTTRSLLYGRLAPVSGGGERALFPGIFVSICFLAALARLPRRRREAAAESAFPARLWTVLVLMLLSFTFWTHTIWRGHTIPLPLALLHWFPMADQMRVPARWMLPALLGLALLAGDGWRRLADAKFSGARVLAVLGFLLLTAECLTPPIKFKDVPPVDPGAMAWLNRQTYPSPVLILPPAHTGCMVESALLRQPIVNGSNGYFPPSQIHIIQIMTREFPAPPALKMLRGLGVRFVMLNMRAAQAESTDWEPARLPQILQNLPRDLKTIRFGDYLIIDVGPAETDLNRIGIFYRGIEDDIRKVMRKTPK